MPLSIRKSSQWSEGARMVGNVSALDAPRAHEEVDFGTLLLDLWRKELTWFGGRTTSSELAKRSNTVKIAKQNVHRVLFLCFAKSGENNIIHV